MKIDRAVYCQYVTKYIEKVFHRSYYIERPYELGDIWHVHVIDIEPFSSLVPRKV